MSMTARSQHYERVLAICDIPNEWISAAKFVKAKVRNFPHILVGLGIEEKSIIRVISQHS